MLSLSKEIQKSFPFRNEALPFLCKISFIKKAATGTAVAE